MNATNYTHADMPVFNLTHANLKDPPNSTLTAVSTGNYALNCTDYSDIYLFKHDFWNDCNKWISIVLLILGVIGNSLGAFVVSRGFSVINSKKSPVTVEVIKDEVSHRDVGRTTTQKLGVLLKYYLSIMVQKFRAFMNCEKCVEHKLPPDNTEAVFPSRIFPNPARRFGRGKCMTSVRHSAAHSSSTMYQYLLYKFFLVNLANSVLLIISPILKLFGEWDRNPFWTGKGWITYAAHYNYPITKPLLSFGSLIYVFYFAIQMLAVSCPYKFRSLVTRERLKWLLFAALVYCVVWYVPSSHWFKVKQFTICDKPWSRDVILNLRTIREVQHYYVNTRTGKLFQSAHDGYAYQWNIQRISWSQQNILWEVYQISRELLLNVLPFTCVLLFKFVVLQRRRRKIEHRSDQSSADHKGEATGSHVLASSHDCNNITSVSQALSRSRTEKSRQNCDSIKWSGNIVESLCVIPTHVADKITDHVNLVGNASNTKPYIPGENLNHTGNPNADINKSLTFTNTLTLPVSQMTSGQDNKMRPVNGKISEFYFRWLFLCNLSNMYHMCCDDNKSNEHHSVCLENEEQHNARGKKDKFRPKTRPKSMSKKFSERRQHLRTLLILTVEFIFLILPVSLVQMFMDLLYNKISGQFLATLYIFVTMLQFVYVSCTFYINFLFNVYFQRTVLDCFKN